MQDKSLLITGEELAELLNISVRQANTIIQQVNARLKEQGFIVINTRPLRAPRSAVLKYLNIREEQQ